MKHLKPRLPVDGPRLTSDAPWPPPKGWRAGTVPQVLDGPQNPPPGGMAPTVAAFQHQVRPFARLLGRTWPMLTQEDGGDVGDVALGYGAQIRLPVGKERPLANRLFHS